MVERASCSFGLPPRLRAATSPLARFALSAEGVGSSVFALTYGLCCAYNGCCASTRDRFAKARFVVWRCPRSKRRGGCDRL
jgi:hypothetical protein